MERMYDNKFYFPNLLINILQLFLFILILNILLIYQFLLHYHYNYLFVNELTYLISRYNEYLVGWGKIGFTHDKLRGIVFWCPLLRN